MVSGDRIVVAGTPSFSPPTDLMNASRSIAQLRAWRTFRSLTFWLLTHMYQTNGVCSDSTREDSDGSLATLDTSDGSRLFAIAYWSSPTSAISRLLNVV